MCPHLQSVRQGCVQHGEDGQVRAQVGNNTTAEALGAHNRPYVYI